MNYKRYYGTQDNRFHLLPPGISKKYKPTADTEKTRQEIRQVLKISNDEQVILFIGSGFYGKGLDRLLYALAQLPSEIKNKTKVWITGKGRQWFYQVKAYCLGIKNQIQFLGLRQDVPQLLTGGDILVHPARNEAGGMVILEAIINGLPTIASAECGFAPHIKKAQAGIVLSEPFKQIELNAALLHLLTLSNEQRNQLKQNGLHYGKIADLYNRIEQIVDFIESRKFKNL